MPVSQLRRRHGASWLLEQTVFIFNTTTATVLCRLTDDCRRVIFGTINHSMTIGVIVELKQETFLGKVYCVIKDPWQFVSFRHWKVNSERNLESYLQYGVWIHSASKGADGSTTLTLLLWHVKNKWPLSPNSTLGHCVVTGHHTNFVSHQLVIKNEWRINWTLPLYWSSNGKRTEVVLVPYRTIPYHSAKWCTIPVSRDEISESPLRTYSYSAWRGKFRDASVVSNSETDWLWRSLYYLLLMENILSDSTWTCFWSKYGTVN